MIAQINPYQKISKKELFLLFWFDKMVIHAGDEAFDYLQDFHVSESLIAQYNASLCDIYINDFSIRAGLYQAGMWDISTLDVLGVFHALKAASCLDVYDICDFGEENTINFTKYYVESIRYFYYCYDTDIRYPAKPVIWDASRSCDDYMIQKLERGAIMETFVDREFLRYGIDIGFFYHPAGQNAGENRLGIEIKHDEKSVITGNYYIEFAERHRTDKEFVPSGIFKNDNSRYWLIGTPDDYCIVEKRVLQQIYYSMNQEQPDWQNGKKFVGNDRSLGFIIKKDVLHVVAVSRSIEGFVNLIFRPYGNYIA